MIRVRFHGRGGHGVKTASRIVGTAAFLAGYQAQDSPIYGAERRGAPVVAFTRIDRAPIHERGVITQPNLIILRCLSLRKWVFSKEPRQLPRFSSTVKILRPANMDLPKRVVGLDLTSRTLDRLGKASILSTGLGSAAARLTGLIAVDQLREAIREELLELGLGSTVIENNLRLAQEVFEALEEVPLRPVERSATEPLHPIGYDDVLWGTPSILAPGNAIERQTGFWRTERPEIDRELCTRCGLCFVQCPDGAIALDEQGYPIIDYEHCKGCLICLEVCRPRAVKSIKDVRSW